MLKSYGKRYDAIVIGARCAGAATAMLLARRGLRVLAIDRDRYGTDTLSTHALMRGGVLQLHRWGILEGLRAAGTPTVRSTSFHYADDVVDIQIKPQDGVDGLYAPRRTVIDRLLVDAARESGAEIAYRTRLTDLMRSPEGRVCGVHLRDSGGHDSQVAAELVNAADRTERYRGFVGQVGFFRQSSGPGWALVGDAGYFKDPITAHGMTDALIDADLLARAAAAGTEDALAAYQRARDARAVGLFDVTDAIASFDWDLTMVQRLHRSLSDEMKKET